MKENVPLMETVTVTVQVPSHIRDLVLFAKSLMGQPIPMTDEELIARARAFWDNQHGED